MKTESFKALSESVKRVLLGEAPESPEAAEPDIEALAADVGAPPAEEPEAEAPEANDAPKNGKGKLKYAAVCSKDGEESTVLLSKDGLEEFIHDNGAKCITALYELGKETKIPVVKIKA